MNGDTKMKTEYIYKDLYIGNLPDFSDEASKDADYQKALNKLSLLEDDIRRISGKNVNKLMDAYQKKEYYLHSAETISAFKSGFRLAYLLFSQISD